VRQNGELTVWCAQHDRVTLEPCKARAYELPSLSGQESDNIVLLLMSLPHPSADVVKSIEGAIKWFQKSEIKGIQKEYFTNSDGKKTIAWFPVKTVQLFGHVFMIWKQTGLFSATVMALKNMIYRKSDTNAEMVIVGITKMEARC